MINPCDTLYLTETAYRENLKVRANSKTRPRNFFAVNDPVYHSGDSYNGLFYKGKSAVNRGLSVGGHILLTMRLYTNQDAGNILWEWAFEALALDTRIAGYDDQTEETWYVTADDPTVPFQSMIVGYAGRDASTKTPQTVKWEVKGLGSMSPASSTDKDLGVFASDLTMPTVAGAKGVVQAILQGDSPTAASFKTVEVLPGKPGAMTLDQVGEPSARGVGQMAVTVTDKDGQAVAGIDLRFGTSYCLFKEGLVIIYLMHQVAFFKDPLDIAPEESRYFKVAEKLRDIFENKPLPQIVKNLWEQVKKKEVEVPEWYR